MAFVGRGPALSRTASIIGARGTFAWRGLARIRALRVVLVTEGSYAARRGIILAALSNLNAALFRGAGAWPIGKARSPAILGGGTVLSLKGLARVVVGAWPPLRGVRVSGAKGARLRAGTLSPSGGVAVTRGGLPLANTHVGALLGRYVLRFRHVAAGVWAGSDFLISRRVRTRGSPEGGVWTATSGRPPLGATSRNPTRASAATLRQAHEVRSFAAHPPPLCTLGDDFNYPIIISSVAPHDIGSSTRTRVHSCSRHTRPSSSCRWPRSAKCFLACLRNHDGRRFRSASPRLAIYGYSPTF